MYGRSGYADLVSSASGESLRQDDDAKRFAKARVQLERDRRCANLKLVTQVNMFRIALANIRFPATPEESVALAEQAITQAFIERAGLICFPECFTPGYRGMGKLVPPPDHALLERAWSDIAAA